MRILILGENCLTKLTSFEKSIFSVFLYVASIYARQLAAVTPKNHTIKGMEKYEDINFDEKCDVVHIHFKTCLSLQAYKIADEFRKRGKKVILSGSHPTVLYEEAKQHGDSVIIGSAEHLWPIVVKDLEKGKLKPFYRAKENINQNSFSFSGISTTSNDSIIGAIEATRGCPYKCDFCQESNILHGSIFRTRPIDDVIKEIKSIQQKFLLFCDVSMTIDLSYTKELFKSMKNLNKKFVCEGNADALAEDEELLRLSHEAGCIEWTIGFESFTQQVLEGIHKKTNKVEDYIHVVKNVHKYKMSALGNFIFGFDEDAPDVFEFTQKNIAKLGLDSARFAILIPYPGTPLFKRLEKEKRILTRDWSKYDRRTAVFEPRNMSKEDLENGFKKISNNFNSIPNMLFRDCRSLTLGFYPFLATFSRNLENYMTRARK